MDDSQLAAHPETDAATLRDIAERTPLARPLVAVHPRAYPDLLTWLGALDDPAVDAALGHRGQTEAVSHSVPVQAQVPIEATVVPAVRPARDAGAGLSNVPRAGHRVPSVKGDARRSFTAIGVGLAAGLVCVALAAPFVPRGMAWLSLPWVGGEAAQPGLGGGEPVEPALFTEGARVGWSIDAADLVPERPDVGPAVFDLGIATDNDAAQFLGREVLDAGSVWIVNVAYRSDLSEQTPLVEQGRVVAIDPMSGEVAWTLDPSITSCENAGEGSVACYAPTTSELVLVDSATGSVRWRAPGGAPNTATEGDVVVACGVGEAVGLDLETGRELWRSPTLVEGGHWMDCEAANGLLIVDIATASTVLETATGNLVAQAPYGGLLIEDGRVWVSSAAEAEVVREDLVDWRETFPFWRPEGSQGRYYLEWSEQSMRGVDPGTGAILWAVETTWTGDLKLASTSTADRFVMADASLVTIIDPTGVADSVVLPLPGWIGESATVSVLGDGVVSVTSGNRVLALDPFAGVPLWELDVQGASVDLSTGDSPLLVSSDRQTLSRIVPARPAASGETVQVTLPDEVPQCPGDTIELARAELSNGWVLVCGYYADQPTYLAVHSDSTGDLVAQNAYTSDGTLVTEAVVYDPDLARYTATLGDGSVLWLEHTPATLGLRDASGVTTVQESVLYIFFVELGEGGVAQGTGDFDVAAPDHTAQSQVNYFSEIVRRSEEARAELGPAVAAVRECTQADGDYSEQIATIASVRDNRAELLAAIQAAPVDLVPDGTELVDELSAALSVSYEADLSYLDAAVSADAFGCDPANGDFGSEFTQPATDTKTAFAEHWNSVIAPQFGVPTVSRESL